MTCEELRADYLLYAMGTLGEPETGELRAHLARGCEVCTQGLRQASALAYSMGAVLSGPEAPRPLRRRVLAITNSEEKRPAWRMPFARGWAWAAVCLLLALVPAVLWQRAESRWHAQDAANARVLASQRASADQLRQEIATLKQSPSVAAVPIFALELERGGGSAQEAPKQLAVPRGAAAMVLALPSDLVRQASTVEIRDASGRTVWTVTPSAASDADSTGLTIPGQLLSAGRYTVVMLAHGRMLAHLAFELTLR